MHWGQTCHLALTVPLACPSDTRRLLFLSPEELRLHCQGGVFFFFLFVCFKALEFQWNSA